MINTMTSRGYRDHWIDSIFPSGDADQPITGIRYDDARAFCGWLQQVLADDYSYRLPRVNELEQHADALARPALYSGGVRSLWTLPYFSLDSGTRYGRLLNVRQRHENRIIPYMPASTRLPESHLHQLIAADSAEVHRRSIEMIRQSYSKAHSSYVDADVELQVDSLLSTEYLPYLSPIVTFDASPAEEPAQQLQNAWATPSRR
jgi:hypothetical protein